MATILCIDDEPDSLEIRQRVLERQEHRVLMAVSGQQGLRLLQANTIDLIILDYRMARMNGMTVSREIKLLNPSIPIIMLSGFPELPGEGIGVVDRWILKGRTQDLLDVVSVLLHVRRNA